jgi:hypothetical protein
VLDPALILVLQQVQWIGPVGAGCPLAVAAKRHLLPQGFAHCLALRPRTFYLLTRLFCHRRRSLSEKKISEISDTRSNLRSIVNFDWVEIRATIYYKSASGKLSKVSLQDHTAEAKSRLGLPDRLES